MKKAKRYQTRTVTFTFDETSEIPSDATFMSHVSIGLDRLADDLGDSLKYHIMEIELVKRKKKGK